MRRCFSVTSERSSLLVAILVALATCLLLPNSAAAQATAAINGTVRDQGGAVIADATVVLHNRDTNLNRTVTTNSVGVYVIPDIQPGNYDLRVTRTGFSPAVKSGIALLVNQTATFDFTMQTGTVNEVVSVQANAVTLETSTAELGEAIVQKQVNDLPLNGRNFTQMLNLTPGVSTVNVAQNSATSGGVWSNPIGTFSYPSVNGQTNRSNLFLLDGVNNQGSFGSTYAVPPIVDDISEFKVQSHNDDASFGGVLGGVVNVVTKSGTSSFHGAAWEFLRNTSLDARNPFLANVTPFQQNQFGASFGGPLWIPGEHEKKTFFYLSYEGFRNHTAASNFYNTPTTDQLGGDLTGIGAQIYNPWSSQPFMCDGSGNPLPATNNIQPAGTPCNKIPANMIDQSMVSYAQTLFPAPNLTGNPNFNGLDTSKVITRQDEGNARLDHRFTDHDSVWARYTSFRQPVTGSGGFLGLIHAQTTNGYNLAASYTRSFSSSSVMELHFGRTDVNIDQGSTFTGAPSSFGPQIFSPNFAGNFRGGVSMIPEVVIQGYIGNPNPSAHGAAQVDDTKVSDIWEWGGEFTKNVGRHTFRAGADFASNNSNALYLNSNVLFTAANTAALDGTGGNALASFLLGVPNEAARRNVIETEHGGWVNGFYAMDQWKVTSKLSVNLGVRYDFTLVPVYGDNADANNFVGDMDFRDGTYILARNAPSCDQTNAAPCIPGGNLPDHVLVTPLGGGAIYHNDFSNIQPRLGVAYQIFPNTVIRAGYGRFYDNWAAITQTGQNYEGTWPSLDQLGASNLNAVTQGPPSATAEDPLGLGTAQPLPPATPFTQSTWFADPYLKRPYSDQWNFGIQQQVTSNTVLTANYVGSVGRKLDVGGAYNVAMVPGGNDSCPVSTPNCGAPFPYIGATAYDRSVGKASYNALQVSMNGRQIHGLTYLISYTWSKSLDLGCTGWYGVEGCSIQNPYDLQADKGPSATDLPHIFSAAWVYALPFGKDKKFSSGNAVLDTLIGGWNLNGVLSMSSGTPFDVGTPKDIAHTGNYNYGNSYDGYERLNLVGNPYPSTKTPAEWLNPAGFQLPATLTFGNLGRDSLRSDWSKGLDLSIFRQIPIHERMHLEFRFEMFNATNTPVWAVPITNYDLYNPNPTPTSPNLFGVVTSTANTARQLQFGLKLYY
ncbi:MAG TPA: carboxypeptidase regulatory-like domain-containing protein [Terriglobales bacterium]|nr:carboxypeptidase regulatory-like domain-containing protein [Terriglobales bacterium]